MVRKVGRASCVLATLTLGACFEDGSNADSGGTNSGTDSSATDATSATTSTSTTTASSSTTAASDSDAGTTAGSTSGTTDPTTGTTGTTDPTAGSSTGDSTTGGIMCGDTETACGDTCVDTDTDVAHCGACNDPCVTNSCAAGVCEAIVLSTGNGRLFMVEADGQYVYFGGDGVNIKRVDKDGNGEITLWSQTNEYAYDHALTSTALVWGSDWAQPAGVRGCATPDCNGGAGEYVAGNNLTAMTYADDVLYWNQAGTIKAKGWPNGAVSDFATAQGSSIRALGSDDTFIYWYAFVASNNHAVRKKSQAGGSVTTLASNLVTASHGIAAGPSAVYFAGANNDLMKTALPNGGTPTVFASSTYGTVRSVVADADNVYWTARSATGAVHGCPHAGCQGAPDVLATGDKPWGLAQDADAVYYVTEAGEVGMIPKAP